MVRSRRATVRSRARVAGCAWLAGVCGLVLVAGLGTAASAADPVDDGLWYYNLSGMAEVHQRTQGEGITIAVLDEPTNPASPDLIGANLTVQEPAFCADVAGGPAVSATTTDEIAVHGVNMDSIIVGTGAGVNGQIGARGIAPKARVIHYASRYHERCLPAANAPEPRDGMALAIDMAVGAGAKIISMSHSLPSHTDTAYPAIARAMKAGVIIVAASPHSRYKGMEFPASANGVVAVDLIDSKSQLSADNTTDPLLTVVAPGAGFRGIDGTWSTYVYTTGSSEATAYTSAALALVWSAYPNATANQILQTLITNTGPTDHAVKHDNSWGYGIVNVRHMLAVDPTTYPDVNPLLRDNNDPETRPTIAQIANPDLPYTRPSEPGTTPDASPSPSASAAATGDASGPSTADESGVNVPLITGLGLAGLLVLGVIATVVVLVVINRRHATARSQTPGAG